jgi:hypothetical protein
MVGHRLSKPRAPSPISPARPFIAKGTGMQAAYYALHYGKEYLAWSIRSIQDAVDEIFLFYSAKPSYGHSQGVRCPDTREELIAEAHRFANKPIHWVDGTWNGEGHHRDSALAHIAERGGHQVLVVDSDEVWPEGYAKAALDHATQANSSRIWLAQFVHFWRSFKWRVHDHFEPVRVIDLRHGSGQARLPTDRHVLHFGYAQREEIIRYKWTCHGHQNELRPDWLNKFCGWTPEVQDLHPVVIGLWDHVHPIDETVQFEIESVLSDHPYRTLDLIP